MSNIKLDLKEFKHVSSDDGSTTLRHPLGHMITLAHKSLSKDNQAQLAALAKLPKPEEVPPVSQPKAKKDREDIEKTMKAEGGSIDSRTNRRDNEMGIHVEYGKGTSNHKFDTPHNIKERHKSNLQDLKYMAKPKLKGLAEGGKVEEPSVWETVKKTVSDSLTDEPQKNNQPAPLDRQKARDMSRVFKAEGGDIEQTLAGEGNSTEEPNMSEAKPQAPVNININSGPQPQAQPSPNPVPAPAPQAPDTSPQMEAPAPAQNMSMPQDPSANQQVPEAQVANPPEPKPTQPQHQTPAQAEAPEEEVDAQQSGEGSAPTPEQHKEAVQNELHSELEAWQQDLANGHIHPKTMHDLLWKDENGKDKGLLGKIGTIFGLLASGAGSGLTGQPNVLLSTLQKQIDNDVAAQEKSKENAQNLLRINQQQMMNEVEKKYKGQLGQLTEAQRAGIQKDIQIKSIALTRTMQNIGALNEMANTIKALPPGSPQRVQMEQTMGMLYPIMTAENSDILAKAAAASALITGFGGDNRQGLIMSGQPEIVDFKEQRTIPGIPGIAARPIPEEKRNQIIDAQVLTDKGRDILRFAKKHKGTWSPKDLKVGGQKAEELLNFYSKAVDKGTMTKGRMEWLDKQIDKDPTSIFQDLLGNNAKLEEIINSNEGRKELQLKSLGLTPPKKESQYDGMKPKEGAMSQDVDKKPMKFTNGKWRYVK